MKDYKQRANDKYNKKAIKHYGIAFNKLTEPDVVNFMDRLPNKSDYVRQHILKDMKDKSN